jgi:glycosyltransferase involved in cell wall biosynthesis
MTIFENSGHQRPTISFVIPVYNAGVAFEKCIRSLEELCPAPDEILIVDDGCTDDCLCFAHRAGFKVIPTSGRLGPGAARNLGAQNTTGDLICFVDADCSIIPNALDHFTSIFASHPRVHAVIGSYDDSPSSKNLLSQYKNLLHHYTHQQSGDEGFTFWGACGVIRRSVFQNLGGFDRSYSKASIEDIELGYRIRASNGHIRVCRDLQVKHHKTWRPINLFHTDFFLRAIPWSRLIIRSGKMENGLNTNWLSRLRVVLTGAIAACCIMGFVLPKLFLLAAWLVLILLWCDWKTLSWFFKKRGLLFTLAVIPWHWFSHFYSGCGFLAAMLLHWFDQPSIPKQTDCTDSQHENRIQPV